MEDCVKRILRSGDSEPSEKSTKCGSKHRAVSLKHGGRHWPLAGESTPATVATNRLDPVAAGSSRDDEKRNSIAVRSFASLLLLAANSSTLTAVDTTTTTSSVTGKRNWAIEPDLDRRDDFEGGCENNDSDSTQTNKEIIEDDGDTGMDTNDCIPEGKNVGEDDSRSLMVPNNQKVASWEEYFHLLVEYENKHKITTVPRSDLPLGPWAEKQRKAYREGTLSNSRVERLNSIGFSWRFEKGLQWMEVYNRLISYKEQHDGSTNVPQSSKEYCMLGRWVSQQRVRYRGGTLSKTKIALLESIGFQWQLLDKNHWMKMYQRLVEYKKKNGTAGVPQRCKADPKLSKWVHNQRQRCRHKDQMKLLNAIGFEWQSSGRFRRSQWQEMYQRLVEYKKLHGTTLVPQRYEADRSLGRWVNKQRTYCKLKSRVDLLNAIGFVWNVKEKKDDNVLSSSCGIIQKELRLDSCATQNPTKTIPNSGDE
jgi:hypothetical protein